MNWQLGTSFRRRREPDGRVTITLTTDAADAELAMQAIHAATTTDGERPLVERRADALIAVADTETAGRATCEARSPRNSPGVSASLRQQLKTRDGRCVWPGCDAIHHRLLHTGGYAIRRRSDTGWEVQRADGSIIDSTPAKLTVPRNRIRAVVENPEAIRGRWSGDPLDTGRLLRMPVRRDPVPTG